MTRQVRIIPERPDVCTEPRWKAFAESNRSQTSDRYVYQEAVWSVCMQQPRAVEKAAHGMPRAQVDVEITFPDNSCRTENERHDMVFFETLPLQRLR